MSDNEWLKAKRNVDAALHTPTNSLAELTRLRADLAAARADAKSWKTVALSNQAASQSHQERWAKAEAELAEMTTERDAALEWAEKAERLERALAAAQEREQRMREALILAERIKYMEGKDDGWIAATMGGCITAALSEASLEPYQRLFPRARAAFSAMRGEP